MKHLQSNYETNNDRIIMSGKKQMPQIESVQVALFLEGYIPNADDVAKQLFDNELSQYSRINPAVTVAAVQIEEYTVQVQVSPGRIDIVVNSSTAGTLKDLKSGIDLISSQMEKITLIGMISRLALIVNAFDNTTGLEDAIRLGRIQLTEAVLPKSGADFDMKLNVPIQSTKQAGLKINRLYQLRPMHVMNLVFIPGVSQSNLTSPQSSPEMRLTHQLDINTDAENKVAAGRLPEVFNELVTCADFLIENGYQGLFE